MSDSKAPTPDSVRSAIWDAHNTGLKSAIRNQDPYTVALYEAREAVAEAYPGCQNAILSRDTMLNWDSGRLVQDEYNKRKPK